jgi:hypothetical protein
VEVRSIDPEVKCSSLVQPIDLGGVDGLAEIIFGNLPAAAGSIAVAALSAGAGLWLLREEPGRETENQAGSLP